MKGRTEITEITNLASSKFPASTQFWSLKPLDLTQSIAPFTFL